MRRLAFVALAIGASVLALWPAVAKAGGGGGGGSLCAGFASGDMLVMRDSCFEGVAHFVNAGATLVVHNEGNVPHSFTAVDGSFDTGLLAPGESAEIPLGVDGIIRAFCMLHGTAQGAGMAGVLVIGEPAASGTRPFQAVALGTLGVALGGAVATAASWRRGRAAAPGGRPD